MSETISTADTQPLSDDASAFALRRPFFFAGSGANARVGVLVIHGFSGTPFEVRPLGEALAKRGYTVYGPRLDGHGETTEIFMRSTHATWAATIDGAFLELKERVDAIYVCGLSLGGLLTLDLASRRGADILAIASLAAPLWLQRHIELIISVTKRLRRNPQVVVPKLAGSDIADPAMRARNNLAQGNIGLPIPSVLSLHAFMGIVRAELPTVNVPTLVMHSRKDHTAPFACMAEVARSVGTKDIETIALERSFHVITLDVERQQVIDAVASHLQRHT